MNSAAPTADTMRRRLAHDEQEILARWGRGDGWGGMGLEQAFEATRYLATIAFAGLSMHVAERINEHLDGTRRLVVTSSEPPTPVDNPWLPRRTLWENQLETHRLPQSRRKTRSTYDDEHLMPWLDQLTDTQTAAAGSIADEAEGDAGDLRRLKRLFDDWVGHRADASEHLLNDYLATEPRNSAAIARRIQLTYTVVPASYRRSATTNAGANRELLGTPFLGTHRWAVLHCDSVAAESDLILRNGGALKNPTYIKAEQLARLPWPSGHLSWDGLTSVVSEDPAEKGDYDFGFSGVPASPAKTSTKCTAAFTDSLGPPNPRTDPILTLVRLADHGARRNVYRFAVEQGQVFDRTTATRQLR